MRRSLSLISEGMLSSSAKKAITIASIGWLVISGNIPPSDSSGTSGGGGAGISTLTPLDLANEEQLRVVKIDEENLLNIIKIFLECQ